MVSILLLLVRGQLFKTSVVLERLARRGRAQVHDDVTCNLPNQNSNSARVTCGVEASQR
jgi:hypothetical protein